ncbi:MAG: DUF488 family protein [Acidobacteriota bacterium]
MFYRRKIVLALLELGEGELDRTRLGLLLCLVSKRQKKPAYDFVPTRNGCRSFSAEADLDAMARNGDVLENGSLVKSAMPEGMAAQLKADDAEAVRSVMKEFGALDAPALLRATIAADPFLGIHLDHAEEVLDAALQRAVLDDRPSFDETALFTIGYEGISLEAYLNRLIRNGVRVLCDVRKNAMSMKFGFNKYQLTRFCADVLIGYRHMPELGIQSDLRKDLESEEDRASLFEWYERTTLRETGDAQEALVDLLEAEGRIALTCFEADPVRCHRKRLADALERRMSGRHPLIHI